MSKLLTLDSNIFISETKGDEEYSDRCGEIILVSLDEGIVLRVKDKGLPIEVYHPKEFPYS